MTDQPTESTPGAEEAEADEAAKADQAPASAAPTTPASTTPAPTTPAPAAPTTPTASAASASASGSAAPAASAGSTATQLVEPAIDISWIPVQRRPKVVIKADLLPALSIGLLLAVFGLPLGWIWSRIAPPQRVGVSSNGTVLPLVDETYHAWDDVAIYLLMGLAFGLVAGVAVWLLRERRGPTVLVATVLGAVAAGWLMTTTGVSFAAGDYTVPASLKIGSLFDLAPQLNTAWILLAPPLGVALAYLVLSAWSGTEDLGRRLG